jgi:hypothetical protein
VVWADRRPMFTISAAGRIGNSIKTGRIREYLSGFSSSAYLKHPRHHEQPMQMSGAKPGFPLVCA